MQGLSSVLEDWNGFDVALASHCPSSADGRRPVLTLDNRGIGLSSVPEGPYPVERMAKDVLHVASAVLGAGTRFHVLGISMGGMIAQVCCLLSVVCCLWLDAVPMI
jgi:pimeloyl-ACP methyl ester carboxylesterase